MSIEELLKPRFKLIADYPGNSQPIGTVTVEVSTASYFRKFPANFKELAWYEDRRPEDLLEVKYVKRIGKYKNGEVLKVAAPDQDYRIWHEDNEIEFRFIKTYDLIPVTEAEYTAYQSTKTP